MHAPDIEFDPDDNFGGGDGDIDFDTDEDSPEKLVWQLLLLVNPGDEETALRQFAAYNDARVEAGDEDTEPVWILKDVIDWTSGFYVAADDNEALIDAINELAARWNLRIDWGVDDPGDEDFLARTDVPALMATAHDRLREYGYTLWTWNTGGETHAGWITQSQDDEAMQVLAPALGIDLRPGSDAF